MKVTTKNNEKQFILDEIKAVYIGFDDNTEVKLNRITEYDIDLDKIEESFIELTNAAVDVEIENHFVGNKNNHIIYVDIEALGFEIGSCKTVEVSYNITCDMHIRKLRTHGEYKEATSMFIQLEGFIK